MVTDGSDAAQDGKNAYAPLRPEPGSDIVIGSSPPGFGARQLHAERGGDRVGAAARTWRARCVVPLACLLAACSSQAGGGDTSLFPEVDASGVETPASALDWGAGEGPVPDVISGDETPQSLPDGAQPDAAPEADVTTDPAGGDTGAAWHVAFVSPAADAPVSGTVTVRLQAVEYPELKLDDLRVSLNGLVVFTDTKLPTEFVLDTAAHPSAALALEAEATWNGVTASDTLSLTSSNPDFVIARVSADRAQLRNGQALALDVDVGKPGLTVTADLGALDAGFDPATGHLADQGDGHYAATLTVSAGNTVADGTYPVLVTATDGTATVSSSHLRLTLANTPQLPLRLEGGLYVPGSVPPATPGFAPPLSLAVDSDVIVTGGSATVDATFAGAPALDEIVGVLVGVDGLAGHFQKPLHGTAGAEPLTLFLRTYAADETPPATLTVRVALKDIRGRVSASTTRALTVVAVGSGDVQVSIAWDTATDVDLHVLEPGGCELYYGHKNCDSGGWLDLDSNPACSIDNINHENVFWPAGQAPLGTYRVRVDYYDDCGGFLSNGLPAAYTVTLRYCGKVELVTGSFAAGSDDMGGAGDGIEVATFNNESCARLVRGDVRYADHAVGPDGTGPWTWKPARHATVEVVRTADDTVLATTATDRLGHYEAFYSNDGAPGVHVRVLSATRPDDGLRRISVMNHPKFKRVYAVTSPSADETLADPLEIDLDIAAAADAGPFNILDVVTGGHDTVRLMTGADLGELMVYWATGADTTDTLFCSPYFYAEGTCSELYALSVQGKDTDRDEYDDMVILKELFKLAVARGARDDNPGGPHDGTRDDPRRAWSEGVSTFFACDVQATSWFVNSRPAGVYLASNLEAIHSPFAFGALPGTLAGDVSEYLVASLLWDLADDRSGETFDFVDLARLPIYDAIFNYLPGTHFVDRATAGVDLVDFLDGWFCRAWGDDANVLALVNGHYLFPYEANGPTDCFGGQ